MRKNIVFDIGNVLVDYRIKEFLASKGYAPEMIGRILKASLMSPYWEAFERCELSEEEALQAFASLDPEIETEICAAYENIHGMLTIRPFAIGLVKELKAKGYQVYYLSNYSSKAFRECNDSLAFMEYMDGGCLSFQEKMTKPDVNFYKCFLERFNLSADECVFVDDTPVNVEVAEQLGFKGIVFDTYENFCSRFSEEVEKRTPTNRNASKQAGELLDYLADIAGKGIVSGQHTQTVSMDEINYIKDVTGKEPKLRGFELLAYSPNINYADADADCLIEVYQNRNTMEEAFAWASASENVTDRILTFTYHWYSPIGGRDKSFYAKNTDFDPEQVLVEGSPERKAFYSDMDKMAALLMPFKDAGIPILWRPFHESDGTWFWWGSKGPKVASELYKLLYDYYVNVHKLDNLLWVWNCKLKEGYPGDEYVDIISVDVYLSEYAPTDYAKEYEELVRETTKKKVAALAEIGYLPDAEMMAKSKTPFSYFMVWSRDFCLGEKFNKRQNFIDVYNHPYVIVS